MKKWLIYVLVVCASVALMPEAEADLTAAVWVNVRLPLARPDIQITAPAPRHRPLAESKPHTAVYDIAAGLVYMPDGTKLEAHSGIGPRMDDPGQVSAKKLGPTPPNVYNLALREHLFHGVQAVRLKPVNEGSMFGRDGILAHPYMLGVTGESFGCVSFKNYPAFLEAFLRGDVDQIVVVPHAKPRRQMFAKARDPSH